MSLPLLQLIPICGNSHPQNRRALPSSQWVCSEKQSQQRNLAVVINDVTQLNDGFSQTLQEKKKEEEVYLPKLTPSSFLSLGDTQEDLEAYKLLSCALYFQTWP